MGMSRERVLELLALMKLKTVANGCTPGEAAKFAAKYAEWVERYQIDEAELRQSARSDQVRRPEPGHPVIISGGTPCDYT